MAPLTISRTVVRARRDQRERWQRFNAVV